jgi:peptide/nickel transport system substrate-binding protein
MMNARISRSFGAAVSTLLLIGAITICLGGTAPGTSGASGSSYDPNGTLHFAFDLATSPVVFDPAKATIYDTSDVIGQLLYDTLLYQQPNGSLTPELATSATIVNPETISVSLRPGLKFQDGTPLNAAAVKFTILRNLAAKSIAFPPEFNDVSSVDLNGDLGLTINLSGPDAGAFYPDLAGLATMPVSPAAVQRNDPNPVTNPMGAGPFRVKQYVPDESLLFVKNPGYWDTKKIKLGGIEFVQATTGTPAAINELKAGTVDVISSDPTQLGALKGGGIEVSTASSPTSKLYFPLCTTHSPLDNVKVRQALNYGLNKVAINKALAGGHGQPAWALVPATSDLYPTNLTNYYAYDPAKAKQLLAQAGYAKGLTLTMIPTPLPVTQSLAEIAQQEWKQIGVNLEIQSSSNFVQDVFVNHIVEVTNANVVRSGLDALSFLYTPGHLGDFCGYQNPTLTSMITQLGALAPTDPHYVKLWKEAQDFVVKNALDVWGIWLPTVIAYNGNRVGGIETVIPGVTAYPDFFTAYVKK